MDLNGAGTILAAYPQMQAELLYSKISNSKLSSEIQGENGSMLIEGINIPKKGHPLLEPGKIRSKYLFLLRNRICVMS